MNIYCANICKHEHEKNITRLWFKIVFKIDVEQSKKKMKSFTSIYIYLTSLRT